MAAVSAADAQEAEPGWPALAGNSAHCRSADGDASRLAIACLIGRVVLEDVSYYVRGRWQPDTCVRFSPDGRLLAIGSYTGWIRMWDVYANRSLWKKKIAEGMVKRVDFSPDGRQVYFGEQSVDAFVYGADTHSGEIRWRFRMAGDLESGRPPAKDEPYGIFRLPGAYGLQTLADGDVLVQGLHSWGGNPMIDEMKRLSRVYRLTPEGRVRWAFPANGPTPYSVIYADADAGGRRFALLIAQKGTQRDAAYPFAEGTLVVLDGASGRLMWQYTFEPLQPHFDRVGFWESISVGPGGRRASVGLFDGRTFLFDLERRRVERAFDFGAPVLISGVPVSARATYNHLAADSMVYFQTDISSVPYASTMDHVVSPPGPHPNATTLTAVKLNGEIAWRYRSGHSFQNFWTSRDGRWLFTAVNRDDERTGREAGGMLFDTHRAGGGTSRLVYFYPVRGKTHFHADLARDGSAFALVETPYRDPETNRLVGEYAVHIVR